MLSRFGAVFDVTDPAAVMNGMPAAEAPSTVSSSAVAEPGIEVMMPHLLSMQARIWAIGRATSPVLSDTSKLETLRSAISPSTSRFSSVVTVTRQGLP